MDRETRTNIVILTTSIVIIAAFILWALLREKEPFVEKSYPVVVATPTPVASPEPPSVSTPAPEKDRATAPKSAPMTAPKMAPVPVVPAHIPTRVRPRPAKPILPEITYAYKVTRDATIEPETICMQYVGWEKACAQATNEPAVYLFIMGPEDDERGMLRLWSPSHHWSKVTTGKKITVE